MNGWTANIFAPCYILSPEVRTFPDVLGLWHQLDGSTSRVRQGLAINSHQNASWKSLPELCSQHMPGVGLRTATCYHIINACSWEKERRLTETPVKQGALSSLSLSPIRMQDACLHLQAMTRRRHFSH